MSSRLIDLSNYFLSVECCDLKFNQCAIIALSRFVVVMQPNHLPVSVVMSGLTDEC